MVSMMMIGVRERIRADRDDGFLADYRRFITDRANILQR